MLARLVLASVVVLLLVAHHHPAGAQNGLSASVVVDAHTSLGPVNPYVFGHNVEAADPQFIFGDRSDTTKGRTGDGLWDCEQHRPVPEVLERARDVGMKVLRYPGGCLVHNFNWKAAVGPLDERPDFTFGVDEFIAFCRAAGAEPLMNVSAYVGDPQDSADLVEYLNAPATPDHPWAQKRAAWGHPEPYGVVYFEMGNESDHGNHDVRPSRRHTPESYAEWFNECSRLMKAVDPEIRMGALMGTGTGPDDAWNWKVLDRAGSNIGFVIVHTYAVGLHGDPGPGVTSDRLMRACMASCEQIEAQLARYRELIRERTGRDVPLAITEYNASMVQEKPLPYRFSFGAALFSADYVRALLRPEANVLMANYWHFVNGYWGMVRGPRLPGDTPRQWKTMPAFHLYRLWGRHFGQQLLATEVEGPTLEFEGLLRARPARAESRMPEDLNLLDGVELASGQTTQLPWRVDGSGLVRMDIKAVTGESYPVLARVAVPEPGTYLLSYEGRRTALNGTCRIGLGLVDSRGWHETHSGNAVEGVQDAGDWCRFSGPLNTLPDCKSLILLWRILPGDAPVSGTVELRNISVTRLPSFPPYAALTATASLSEDEATLYIMVFNKHHDSPVRTHFDVKGFEIGEGRVWTVTAPSMESLTAAELSGRLQAVGDGAFSHTFPPHSMSALQLRRR